MKLIVSRLKQSHTGEYLADVVLDCLNRFHIAELVNLFIIYYLLFLICCARFSLLAWIMHPTVISLLLSLECDCQHLRVPMLVFGVSCIF